MTIVRFVTIQKTDLSSGNVYYVIVDSFSRKEAGCYQFEDQADKLANELNRLFGERQQDKSTE